MSPSFDFAVVGGGRTGTHWLAALLSSHPELACRGDSIDDKKEKVKERFDEATGKIVGKIIHYTHTDSIPAGIPVVHITREALAVMKSAAVLWKMSQSPEDVYGVHFEDTERKTIKVNLEKIRARGEVRKYLDARDIFRKTRDKKNCLEVTYEDLDSSRFEEICNKVLDFLGVPHAPLTSFVKRSEYYVPHKRQGV